MEEVYIDTRIPAYFFGRGYTKVTVWMRDGKCYPSPSGVVSSKLQAACDQLRGQTMKFTEVQAQLWHLLEG